MEWVIRSLRGMKMEIVVRSLFIKPLEQEMSRRICSHKLTITKAFRIQVRPSLIFPFLKSKL